MEITKKELKLAVTSYCNQNFIKNLKITKDDMVTICKKLGYIIPPYLAIEAFLVASGGHAVNGAGPFSPDLLYEWLLQRECRLVRRQLQVPDLKPTH